MIPQGSNVNETGEMCDPRQIKTVMKCTGTPVLNRTLLSAYPAPDRVCARVRNIMASDNPVHYCSDPPGISCPVFSDQRIW